jgi:hypothetical protein
MSAGLPSMTEPLQTSTQVTTPKPSPAMVCMSVHATVPPIFMPASRRKRAITAS